MSDERVNLTLGPIGLEATIEAEGDLVRVVLEGEGLHLRLVLSMHDAARLAEAVDRAVHGLLDEREGE